MHRIFLENEEKKKMKEEIELKEKQEEIELRKLAIKL